MGGVRDARVVLLRMLCVCFAAAGYYAPSIYIVNVCMHMLFYTLLQPSVTAAAETSWYVLCSYDTAVCIVRLLLRCDMIIRSASCPGVKSAEMHD